MQIKIALEAIPVMGPIAVRLVRRLRGSEFDNSVDYWERRYARGGNSGAGSYNQLAQFKADYLNDFVARHDIRTVIEFGSGDGAQLELAAYPEYIGIDVSRTAIDATRRRFDGDRSKTFYHSSEFPPDQKADLILSLDVIYHLVEDEVFEGYMRSLFDAASRYVIIYSSNEDAAPDRHVRHRRFTQWIEENRPDFLLQGRIPNPYPFDDEDPDNTSFADFYIFVRA